MSGGLPACASAADLQRLDGRRVRLTGVYRPVASLKKMPRPGQPREEVFLGAVEIELDGVAVALGGGVRPEAEIARCRDRRVTVEGRLDLQPAGDPNVASQRPVPALLEPSEPQLAE